MESVFQLNNFMQADDTCLSLISQFEVPV
jgi:hypothetical protein